MKTSTLLLAATAQVASAHYFFDSTLINGQATTKYVRESTRAIKYNPIKFSSNPAADIRDGSTIDGPDARCNQGAFTNAGKTDVLTVNAGEEVRVRLGVGATMQHPGPALAYISRAPNDNVKAYDGSGDWAKIFQEGVCKQGADFTKDAWCTWDRNWVAATIPKDTPSGEYLVRFEHIGIHRSHVNQPEHFVSCVQVKVTNGGNGTPGPLVKFPGAYKDTDAYAKFSIYNGYKDFPFPGPAVWTGGSTGNSSGGSTGGSTGGNTGGGTSTSTTLVVVTKPTTSSSPSVANTSSPSAASSASSSSASSATSSPSAASSTSSPSAASSAPTYSPKPPASGCNKRRAARRHQFHRA